MTGYVYRGKTRNLGINLEDANAAIIADREAEGRTPQQAGPPDGRKPRRQRRKAYPYADHGTTRRYFQHHSMGEKPCQPCKDAYRISKKRVPA